MRPNKGATANVVKREREEEKVKKTPVRITDTTLRDAHQSLWATRMRTDDILGIVETVDRVGYYSLECWGGATFDVCLRFLRENPWERLRKIKALAKKTPLQMLLRGQNLVGYRNYADDVVDRFVAHAVENGIDIFRVFDALNDTRNIEAALKAIKKYGGHAQGALCYTTSPVHSVERFVQYAKEQQALGIDSLCIKDMAGILSPVAAERMVSALIKATGLPIQLHCHASSGMATATYVAAVRAGAGAIDCAISTMAGFSSQPPVEALATIFSETPYAANLDFNALETIAQYFLELAPKRRQSNKIEPVIDPNILVHQTPGGMISNFRSQLSQQGMLDKLPQALEEVAKVREELGWCPLVTPTSQIVGAQAAMNVITGERWKVASNEIKNYMRGMYGRPPAPVNAELLKKILGDEKPITHRPADDIPPMLPKATEGLADPKLLQSEEDIISYVIYPEPALDYFKWRALPPDQRPKTPADLELEKQAEPAQAAASTALPLAAAGQLLQNVDYAGIREIVEAARGTGIQELTIRKGDFVLTLSTGGSAAAAVLQPVPAAAVVPAKPSLLKAEPPKETAAAAFGKTINSPLVGKFYVSPGPGKPPFVEEGASVKAGDTVCIVEAMKLFNEIKATEDGKNLKFLVRDGEIVQKGQPLIEYA
jgi:oxaloacetate decarboxylase alpha subunit